MYQLTKCIEFSLGHSEANVTWVSAESISIENKWSIGSRWYRCLIERFRSIYSNKLIDESLHFGKLCGGFKCYYGF